MLPFTLKQLRILKFIKNQSNFIKVTNLINLSQPSLSKQIKVLEKNVNLLLLKKTQKEKIFTLTKSGKIFLNYSERILALCEEICQFLMDLKKKNRGHFIIGIVKHIKINYLAKILIIMIRYLPQMHIEIQVNAKHHIYKKIKKKHIDLAIIEYKIASNFSNCVKRNTFIKKKLNRIQRLKSIQGIQIALNLGLGVFFLSIDSLKTEKKRYVINNCYIGNLLINQTLYILHNSQNYKSKFFEKIFQKFILDYEII